MRGKHPYKPSEPQQVRETGLSEQDLRAFMAKASRPMTIREIAGALKLRHIGRRALTKIMAKWKRRGEVEELSRGRFALIGKSGHSSAPPRQPAKAEPGRHHAASRASQS